METYALNTLCNVASIMGDYFGELAHATEEDEFLKIQGMLLFKVMGKLDMWFNPYDMTVTGMVDDEDVTIGTKTARRLYPHKFTATSIELPDKTIGELEGLLNGEFNVATSSLYPLFDALGFVLKEEEGRWRLREAMKEYSYTEGMESN